MNGVDETVDETVTGGPEPKAPETQRLAFDDDEDFQIPQFLRKDHPEVSDTLEPESEEPISVDNSTENEKMENLNIGMTNAEPVSGGSAQSIAEMTIEQLKAQQAEIDRKIQEKQQVEKQTVINQITQVVKDYNIPIEELVESLGGMKLRRKGTKAKAKYRDPVSGATWSGRGKEPAWIKGQPDRTPFEIQ
jgi:DNA-binding protein H-NS